MGEMRSTKGEFVADDSVIFCEICGLPIGNNEEFVLCPDCATPFHQNCWNIRGGCGNHECKSYVEKKAGSDNTVNRVVFAINEKAKKSLENCEFENALALYKKALSYDRSNDDALIGMLLADARVTSFENLFLLNVEFERFPMYQTIQNRLSHKTKSLLENEIALRKERKRQEKEKQEKIEQERQEKERLEKENKDAKTDTPSQKPKINARKIVLISVILAILLSVIISGVVALWIALAGMTDEPSDYEENDTFKYVVSYNSITIVGVVDQEVESLVIPSKINGMSVTSIGKSAFCDCDSLKSVVIGDNVTEIGELAFFDCDSLESVTGLGGVKTIGDSAFYDCDSLKSVVIGNNVTEIGELAFFGCDSLESVIIPNSVTTIGSYAFEYCISLESVIIGNSVTTIGVGAFYDCYSLASINIPSSVTTIGDGAFRYCTSLESVTIPNSVTTICDYAFGGCNNLTIYCEAESQPSGWSSDWNYSSCPVVWGYTIQPKG